MKRMDPIIVDGIDSLVAEIVPQTDRLISSPPAKAIWLLFKRNAGSWDSLCALVGTCQSQDHLELRNHDCGAIVRCMFDAYVQAAFIGADDSSARGQQFLEFEWIEAHVLPQKFLKQKSKMADKIRNSPLRPEGEKLNTEQFERLKQNYPPPPHMKKKEVRTHWYKGSIPELATQLGLGNVCDWLYFRFHGSVHSSPLALIRGAAYDARILETVASYLVANHARILCQTAGITLSAPAQELVDANNVDITNYE